MNIVNIKAVADGKMSVEKLGVEAIGDDTFRVTLNAPLPYFVSNGYSRNNIPDPQATIEKYGSEWTRTENMVSNGAYKLTEWVLK